MKQIGLAWHNYHDVYLAFPYSQAQRGYAPFNESWDFPEHNRGVSWLTKILPYVEQTSLYNQIVPGYSAIQNLAAAQTVVDVFNCPSDINNRIANKRRDTGLFPTSLTNSAGPSGPYADTYFAVTNYQMALGANWNWGFRYRTTSGRNAGSFTSYPDPTGMGGFNDVFALNAGTNKFWLTRVRDVTDGSSNTIMVGESVSDWDICNWWYNAGCNNAHAAQPINSFAGVPIGFTIESAAMLPRSWQHFSGFYSRHEGGAQFAMADGAVRFVNENIDLNLWRGANTISAGEVLGEF